MTALEVLPFSHPHLRWCTPDGLWLSHEEAAVWLRSGWAVAAHWTPLPPVSSEDGAA
jgi:hypothetical protein